MHADPKKKASGITQILRATRAKELQSSRKISARRAQKTCVNSARVVARTSEYRCSSFPSRRTLLRKITRESSVEMTQMLRKKRAKNLQNFRKSGTPRAQKNCVHSASVRCAYFTTSLRVDPSQQCMQIRKRKRPASGSRKFCAQLARKNCKVPEKFRRAARKELA